MKNYYIAEFLKDLGIVNKEDLDSDYSVKPFQRPCPQWNNMFAKINRVKDRINETRDAVNYITN